MYFLTCVYLPTPAQSALRSPSIQSSRHFGSFFLNPHQGYVYCFESEWRRKREKHRCEKHQSVASHMLLDWGSNLPPRYALTWNWTWNLLVYGTMLQLTELPSQGDVSVLVLTFNIVLSWTFQISHFSGHSLTLSLPHALLFYDISDTDLWPPANGMLYLGELMCIYQK